jgi:3-hydroxybutyryl-CoA dehydrogenase
VSASEKIAVVGAGLMGAGIAQVFAAAGCGVSVCDPVKDARRTLKERIAANLKAIDGDASIADRVSVTNDMALAVHGAAVVFEAAPEKLDIKQTIFRELDQLAAPDTVLASNTSVIPITNIARSAARRERVVGTHWWNPPYLVPLVEVVPTTETAGDTVARMMSLLERVGKKPVYVKKDVPGFVGNRLQHALWREAIAIVEQGICDPETVDLVVKNSFGLRLPVLGPIENADLVGLDLTLDIHKTILPEIDRSPAPSPLLQRKVEAGELGFKTGSGFRQWSDEEIAETRRRLSRHLLERVRN